MATGSVRRPANKSRTTKNRRRDSRNLTNRITGLAGIATAVATLITAVITLLGVVVENQRDKIDQQSQKIDQLQHQGSGPPGPPPWPPPPPPPRFLSELNPAEDKIGGRDTSGVTISNTPYEHSLSFGCKGARVYQAYSVAGNNYISATVGIADNASNVIRVVADVTLSDQNGNRLGPPISVSLGQPQQIIRLSLRGAMKLEIACDGRDRSTGQARSGFRVTLGDAKIE